MKLIQFVRNLFHRRAVVTEIRYQVIRRDPCRVRLSEWCATPDLVNIANGFLRNPEFRMMLDVLDMENPAGNSDTRFIPLEQRAVMQARCEGYRMAISNLENMGILVKQTAPVEAEFGDYQEPPETEAEITT